MTQENRAYLILTAEILVGQDMAECIVETFPQARLLICHNLAELRRDLRTIGTAGGPEGLEIAFLDCAAIAPDEREAILQEIEACGGTIVLLGVNASAASASDPARREGRRNLPMPFDASMLRAHLA
ncbi:hypothetical protein [Szabonella alba]|uniref:Uncharacterized protein n=1 Tax=Szabonella alba TaxID=2804194 RepID=A0A8K0V5F3_9RHOB|nr:hypothetical protein [Szabonella alba]MBL4915728.1 hypothetical protein [Szabonella alba]